MQLHWLCISRRSSEELCDWLLAQVPRPSYSHTASSSELQPISPTHASRSLPRNRSAPALYKNKKTIKFTSHRIRSQNLRKIHRKDNLLNKYRVCTFIGFCLLAKLDKCNAIRVVRSRATLRLQNATFDDFSKLQKISMKKNIVDC